MTTTASMQRRWRFVLLLSTGLLSVTIVLGKLPLEVLVGAALVGVLLYTLVLLAPFVVLRELRRSRTLSAKGALPQAYYYNILAQDRLRNSRWFRVPVLLGPTNRFPTAKLFLQAEAGRLLMNLERWQDAERRLESQVSEYPGDAVSWHNLAITQWQRGNLTQAKMSLGRAIRLGFVQPMPSFLRVAGWWYRISGSSHLGLLRLAAMRAPLYQSLGFHRIALDYLVFDGSPIGSWKRTCAHLALGHLERARQEVRESLVRDPNNPYAWLSLGFLRVQEDSFHEAERAFEAVLRRDPENILAKEQLYILWARIRDHSGRLDALAVLQEYESNPGHQALGRTHLHFSLGNWEECLKAVLDVTPEVTTPSLLEVVGHAHLALGLGATGCGLLRKFFDLAEVSEYPMLDRAGRLTEARRALEKHQRPESSPLSS